MNITSCPECGGRVRSVSIGWKCERCQGFIDMEGDFHPHKKEPFIPPMTNADRIRAMSDEELAQFIFELYEQPLKDGYLHWLSQPAEEGT